MAKDKLLTIPIEIEKRERLNQYCGEKGMTVSQLITRYIDGILDGSINPSSTPLTQSTQSIDIVVNKVIEVLHHPDSLVRQKLDQLTIDSFDLNKRMLSCQQMLKKHITGKEDFNSPSEFEMYQPDEKPTDKLIEQSIEQSLQPYTLEDTKIYLKGKLDYNRTREKRSDRITQTDIAIYLRAYDYPHPANKKWNRDEVRDVCKLWSLRT